MNVSVHIPSPASAVPPGPMMSKVWKSSLSRQTSRMVPRKKVDCILGNDK